jgi:uncharacterized protein YuzE
MTRKVLRTDLKLETCGQEESTYPHHQTSHAKGCYIRFKDGKTKHATERQDCIIDYDNSGEIIGIEFYDGLNNLEDKA